MPRNSGIVALALSLFGGAKTPLPLLNSLALPYAYRDWMNVLIDWTDGCIAMSNDDMDEVWEQTTNGTVVVIVP